MRNKITYVALLVLLLGAGQVEGQWWNTTLGNGSLSPTLSFVGTNDGVPLNFRTNNFLRMRMNNTLSNNVNGQGILPRDGYVGISGRPDFWTAAGALGPFSRLHLADEVGTNASLVYAQQLGYRSWMRNGITFTGNSDQSYIGHKYAGNDNTDFVIQWSDNPNGSPWGTDRMKFVFSSTFTGATKGMGSANGMEAMRFWPKNGAEVNVGVGDFAPTTVGDPTERVDILDGRLRIRQLPSEVGNTTLTKVLVVDDAAAPSAQRGVIKWREMMTNSCSTTYFVPRSNGSASGSLVCSQIFDNAINVGIGNTAPLQKLHVTGNMTATGFVTAQDASLGFCLTSANTRVLAHGAQIATLGVGYGAGLGGAYNTNVGDQAGAALTTGFGNTMIGNRSGLNTSTTAEYNTFIGLRAGTQNMTGSHNVAVGAAYGSNTGFNVGPISANLTNTGAFGWLAAVSTCNTQRFGDLDVRRWGFGLDPIDPSRVISVNLMPTNVYSSDCGVPATPGMNSVAYMDLGGVWNTASDRNLKSGIKALNGKDVLAKLAEMPMYEWNYTHDPKVRHYGPMAQDFYATYGLGHDSVSIGTIDPAGVALASIKGLNDIVMELSDKLEKALDRVEELELQQLAQGSELRACCENRQNSESRSSSANSLQIAPNPFDDATRITYSVGCACRAQLQVNGSDGKLIASLVDRRLDVGMYTYDWNTSDIAPGVYICTLLVDGEPVMKQAVKVAR